MKRWGWVALAAGFLLGSGASWAEQPAGAASTADELKKLRAEALKQIEGTVWDVKLTPIGASAGERKERADKLTFEKGKITSEYLKGEGFGSSNFTLTVGDDRVPVWETMQSAEGKGLAFWRGEMVTSGMRGILSRHPGEGAAEDYAFSGKGVKAAPPATPAPTAAPAPVEPAAAETTPAAEPGIEPAAAATAPATTAVEPAPAATPPPPAAAPQQPAETKKKRGWF